MKEFFRVIIIVFIYWLVIVPILLNYTELNSVHEIGSLELIAFLIIGFVPYLGQLIVGIISLFSKVNPKLFYLSNLLQLPAFYFLYINYKDNSINYVRILITYYSILFILNIILIKVFYKKFSTTLSKTEDWRRHEYFQITCVPVRELI